jgi:hypothetical protein
MKALITDGKNNGKVMRLTESAAQERFLEELNLDEIIDKDAGTGAYKMTEEDAEWFKNVIREDTKAYREGRRVSKYFGHAFNIDSGKDEARPYVGSESVTAADGRLGMALAASDIQDQYTFWVEQYDLYAQGFIAFSARDFSDAIDRGADLIHEYGREIVETYQEMDVGDIRKVGTISVCKLR